MVVRFFASGAPPAPYRICPNAPGRLITLGVKVIPTGAPARPILLSGFQVALRTANMEDEIVVGISRFSEKMIEADDSVTRSAPYALDRRTESRAHTPPPRSEDSAALTAGSAGRDRQLVGLERIGAERSEAGAGVKGGTSMEA